MIGPHHSIIVRFTSTGHSAAACTASCSDDRSYFVRTDSGSFIFFFNVTATTEIYTLLYTLSLHDALPISCSVFALTSRFEGMPNTVLEAMRSEEHTSELQSHSNISYAVFCLKKKKK